MSGVLKPCLECAYTSTPNAGVVSLVARPGSAEWRVSA
jgi:hypothetical protein